MEAPFFLSFANGGEFSSFAAALQQFREKKATKTMIVLLSPETKRERLGRRR
jgi:hypothetical protein